MIATCVVLVMAACSGGSSSAPPAPRVAPSIAVIEPVDGATDVEPSVPITIVLSSDSTELLPSDVVVTDGGNVLPGTLAQVGTSLEWRWTPTQELPRRATINVTVAAQSASFTVRDHVLEAEFTLPGQAVDFAVSWPNGRRVIVTQQRRCFEVTSTGLIERFVAIDRRVWPYGDGDFITEERIANNFCVRGNLDGSVERTQIPLNMLVGDVNANGDVVVHVPITVGTPSDWGLWRLMRGDLNFSFAGTTIGEYVWDEPCIQADGTVALAYSQDNRVRLSHFAVGDVVGVHDELSINGSFVRYDAAADGRGVLALLYADMTSSGLIETVVKVARYEPGAGLTMLSEAADSWTTGLGNGQANPLGIIEGVYVGEFGSAAVVVERGFYSVFQLPGTAPTLIVNSTSWGIRVEPDDSVSPPVGIMSKLGPASTWGRVQATPQRAEVWGLTSGIDPRLLLMARSRPADIDVGVAYKRPTHWEAFDAWCVSFDDSGRVVLAVTDGVDDPVTTVQLLN